MTVTVHSVNGWTNHYQLFLKAIVQCQWLDKSLSTSLKSLSESNCPQCQWLDKSSTFWNCYLNVLSVWIDKSSTFWNCHLKVTAYSVSDWTNHQQPFWHHCLKAFIHSVNVLTNHHQLLKLLTIWWNVLDSLLLSDAITFGLDCILTSLLGRFYFYNGNQQQG